MELTKNKGLTLIDAKSTKDNKVCCINHSSMKHNVLKSHFHHDMPKQWTNQLSCSCFSTWIRVCLPYNARSLCSQQNDSVKAIQASKTLVKVNSLPSLLKNNLLKHAQTVHLHIRLLIEQLYTTSKNHWRIGYRKTHATPNKWCIMHSVRIEANPSMGFVEWTWDWMLANMLSNNNFIGPYSSITQANQVNYDSSKE